MTELSLRDEPRQVQLDFDTNGRGQFRAVMDRAGRWLALRPRTEAELRSRLLDGGFDGEVVDHALARLKELDLVDDAAFASQWIAERAQRKGLGPEALIAELEAKGVERALSEAALEESGLDELSQATEVASKALRKVVELPLPEQAARLQRLLGRRGFSSEAIAAALKAVLPPEGWD